MKKIVLAFMALIYACSPNTMITGTWKTQQPAPLPYDNILIAALTTHAVAKSTVETDLANLLSANGLKVSKSIDLFPQQMNNSDSDRSVLMDKIKGVNVGAILTISIIRKENESRYVYGADPYDPFYRYPYYRSFWGYYSYWYPTFYSPDYYTERVYYIESNLYDARTDNLVWSAQSRTYDLPEMPAFSKEFSQSIVNRMAVDGVIKAAAVKEKEPSIE